MEGNRIRVSFRSGVEFVYEFNRLSGGWVKQSLQHGKLRRDPEPLALMHVLAELPSRGHRDHAVSIDPKGAEGLPAEYSAGRTAQE